MAFSLHDVAPRLARARDAWIVEQILFAAEQRREAQREIRLATKRLKADRLLAHRELQALRAETTGNPQYVRQRLRKLEAAQRKRKALK